MIIKTQPMIKIVLMIALRIVMRIVMKIASKIALKIVSKIVMTGWEEGGLLSSSQLQTSGQEHHE